MMLIETSKISSRGQVTIPKNVRKNLKTETIGWIVNDDETITIIPIKSAGVLLSKYSKKKDKVFEDIRNEVWKLNTNRYTE